MTQSIDILTDVGPEDNSLVRQGIVPEAGSLAVPEMVEPPVEALEPSMSPEAAELFAQLKTIQAGVHAFEEEYRRQDKQPYIFDSRYARALEQADPIVRKLAGLGYRNVSPL